MPKLSVLIHTHNNAEHLPRVLDSLKSCCSDVLVVDEGSEDETQQVARSHGARVKVAIPGVSAGAFAVDSRHDWVLVLRPSEVVSEQLARAICDWSARSKKDEESGYAVQVSLRENDSTLSEESEMRLVNKRKINWTGDLPPNNTVAPQLPGEIIRHREWEPEQAA